MLLVERCSRGPKWQERRRHARLPTCIYTLRIYTRRMHTGDYCLLQIYYHSASLSLSSLWGPHTVVFFTLIIYICISLSLSIFFCLSLTGCDVSHWEATQIPHSCFMMRILNLLHTHVHTLHTHSHKRTNKIYNEWWWRREACSTHAISNTQNRLLCTYIILLLLLLSYYIIIIFFLCASHTFSLANECVWAHRVWCDGRFHSCIHSSDYFYYHILLLWTTDIIHIENRDWCDCVHYRCSLYVILCCVSVWVWPEWFFSPTWFR